MDLITIWKEPIITTRKNRDGIMDNKHEDCKYKDVTLRYTKKEKLITQVSYPNHRMDIVTLPTSMERKRTNEVYQQYLITTK